MKRILKYRLAVDDEMSIILSDNFIPLHVGRQGTSICLWGIDDNTHLKHSRKIRMFGTGQELPDDMDGYQYIGSDVGTFLVIHVYLEKLNANMSSMQNEPEE